MPSENPWMKASRCAAARSTRACHSSALYSLSVFGETLNCMSFLPLCCLPLGGGFDGYYRKIVAQSGADMAEIVAGLPSQFVAPSLLPLWEKVARSAG